MQVLEQLHKAVIEGLPDQARELATQALAANVAPLTAIEEALDPAMRRSSVTSTRAANTLSPTW